MSKPTRSPQPQQGNALPGIISAVVVLVVLGIVAGILINRAAPPQAETSGQVATTVAGFDASAEPAPTQPAAAPAAGPAVTEPLNPPPDPLPTAASYNFDGPPALEIDPARDYTATILTPRGEIVVELLPEIAPQTVNNFVFLARQNFYNGLTWHRVLENFMAQGGDPTGTGTGGPGYSIPAEFTNQITFDQPGLLAMARSSDPNSAGSQFFITTGAAPWLNEQYTIFGRVVSGQEVVNGIPLRDPQNPADAGAPGETILGVTISES